MSKKKPSKQSDLSTEFFQSLVDQDTDNTVEIIQGCTEEQLRALIVTTMAVSSMLIQYAMKRGIDISKEASIVIELPDDTEKN